MERRASYLHHNLQCGVMYQRSLTARYPVHFVSPWSGYMTDIISVFHAGHFVQVGDQFEL
jgi:hypothetical protein